MLATVSVWTRATGEPRKLGRLQFDGETTSFEYEPDAGDLPGIGIAYDPKAFAGKAIRWKSEFDEPLHPIFMALVPLCNRSNLQYRIAEKALGFKRDTLHKEWLMLPFLGHGSLGHLDVFDTDADAAKWYAGEEPKPIDVAGGEIVSLALDALDSSHEALSLDKVVGAAPSPGGAMTKIMHRIVWPGDGRIVDAIVKFERRDGTRPDLLLMENWAYGVHERMGLPVPERAFFRDDEGNQILATERFDRKDGRVVPLESLYSLLKSYAPDRFPDAFTASYGTSPNFEMVAAALHSRRTAMSADPMADSRDLYTRIVLSFLTGNGDLHLRNLSLLGGRSSARLSPVYDPAPMRLYGTLDIHTAVTFGDLRFWGPRLPEGFGDALFKLGAAFRLTNPVVRSIFENALETTADAVEGILAAGAAEKTAGKFDVLVSPVRGAIEEIALKNGSRPTARRVSGHFVHAEDQAPDDDGIAPSRP
jgi:serine/threonine-protein kinase HipA